MKNIFKRLMCCMLSILLVLGSGISALAADETEVTPVIVINDVNLNPIYNTDDGSVVFDFTDYRFDILFTSGFSANILDLFSADVIEQITSGDMATLDLIMLLVDYLGFTGDVNTIIAKVLELVTPILGSMDLSNIDIGQIISSIDFKQYAEDLKNDMMTAVNNMALLKMNDDGTPANSNIGIVTYEESLEYYYDVDSDLAYSISGEIADSVADEIGYENTYIFTYDWRLDPVDNAASLETYIANLKETTGAEKVSIISEGYGSVVATTYLAENDDASDSVHNFVTVSSEFLGTSLVGDYFKGDIVNEFTNITNYSSAYIRYTNDLSDNPMTSFVTWMLNYIMNNEWEIQAFCHEIKKVVSDIEFFLKLTGVTNEIAKMPGVWALVPTYDYDDALANIYGENEPEFIEKLNTFKDYQYDYEAILVDSKANGVNIYVVAAWDLQILPIGENSSVQSNGIVDTEYASFGAICVDLNDVGEATKAEQAYDDGHDHLSETYDMLTPWYAYGGICNYIDASTCALPENTWFIKNMKHGTFAYDSNSMEFLIWLITAETERTIWQDAAYKQFMTYNRYVVPGILSSDGIVADNSPTGGYLLGDVNLDGVVTALDSRITLDVVDGNTDLEEGSIPFMNADVDGDLEITEDDAKMILDMSAGLVDDMLSGIKFDYTTEQGELDASEYEIEIRPEYNPVKNQLLLTLVVLDAKGSYNGNFVVKYDTEMFSYASSKTNEIANGYMTAGGPDGVEGTLTYGYASFKAISKNDCDENGDLVIGTCYLDVSRDIIPTALTGGASYFYDDEALTFVEPVSIELDEEFFFMLGDADNNRYLSAADARIILRIAAQLETPTDDMMFKRCDVDFDGVITAKDARLVLRASAQLIDFYADDLAE